MAEKMITRTLSVTIVKGTKASLDDDFNVVTEPFELTFDGVKDEEKVQESLNAKAKGAKFKIESREIIDKVWGISLEDFIKYGTEVQRPESQQVKREE